MSTMVAGEVSAARLRALGALGAHGLAELLRRRPDAVAAPVPVSLAEVAERLETAGSVTAALRRLDLPTLQAAEALAALGGTVRRPALERLLGAESDQARAALDRSLSALATDLLVESASI